MPSKAVDRAAEVLDYAQPRDQALKSDVSRGGHWKRGICRKLSELYFRICAINLRQSHPSCVARNEIPAILRKFGVQFATNLRNAPFTNAPFTNAPFSGFLEKFGPAKNHPWMLTTLGCPGTPDPRNSSVEKFLS